MRVQNQFLISKFAFLKLVFNIKGMTRVELHKCLHYDCILLLSKYHIQLMYVKKKHKMYAVIRKKLSPNFCL